MLADNWEYVAAGLLVVGGFVLVGTGVGTGVGAGLVSAGFSMGIQKYTTGEVSLTQTIVDGLLGLGGLGGFTSLARTGSLLSKSGVVKVVGSSAKDGLYSGMTYVVESGLKGDDITVGGLFEAMAFSVGSSKTVERVGDSVGSAIEKYGNDWMKKHSGKFVDGVSSTTGSGISFAQSAFEVDYSDPGWPSELVRIGFYSIIDGSGSYVSSYSTRKLSDPSVSFSDPAVSAGFDLLAEAYGWSAKGFYEIAGAPIVDSWFLDDSASKDDSEGSTGNSNDD